LVQVGAAGNAAAVTLSAGGITQTSNVTLNSNEVIVDVDASPATLTLTGAGASNADTLRVAGTKPVANLNVATGSTLTVGTLDVAASGRVFVNAGSGAGGTIVVDTNHTLATASKVILEEGTLRLNGTGGSAGIEVQVFDNATLDVRGTLTGSAIIADGGKIMGTGTVAGLVNLSGGGTVSPGASPGVLTVDSLVADAASTFQFELGGTVAGIGYDQLKVTGDTLNLDGAHLSLSVTGPLVQNSILNIVWNQGFDTDPGSFGNYLQGSNISLPGGGQVKISYFDDPTTAAVLEMSGGTSVSVQVTAVPEPGSAALLLGGLASVVAARRRRRNA
jgi:hypothetical protein